MNPATAARIRTGLGGLGVLLLGGAALWGGLAERSAEARLGRAERAGALAGHLRAEVGRLEDLASGVGDAWADALTEQDEVDVAHVLERAGRALARHHPLAHRARVAVYVREGPDAPARLVGVLEAGGVPAPPAVLAAHPLRLSDAFVAQELEASDEAASALGLVWFSEAPDGVALDFALAQQLVLEEEDGASRTLDLLAHLQVPFAPPEPVGTWVRLEPPEVPPRSEGRWVALGANDAPGAAAPEPDARLEPGAFRFRFLNEARGAPLRVAAPARLAWGALLLAALGGGLLLAAVRPGGRRGARAEPPDLGAEAAHELRTPLTVMRGTLEVALRRDRTPEEYRGVLAELLEEVKGIQMTQEAVLLLQRGGARALVGEPVDLADLVRAEVERVAEAHPERRVTLAGADAPIPLRGDPSLLARAVGNLLDNAARHSVAGGAIRVDVRAAGRAVEVAVEDDGPGLPAARLERVFERFYRGPEVGQRGIPGAGLGLAIVRWIAEAHGGRAWADPAARGRARFLLTVPSPPRTRPPDPTEPGSYPSA